MSPVTIKPNVIYLASVDIVKQFSTIRQVDHLNTLKSYTYPTAWLLEASTCVCICLNYNNLGLIIKNCYREKIWKWLFVLCRVLERQHSKEHKIATEIDTHNDLRAHFTVPHNRKGGTPLIRTPIFLPSHLSKSGYLAALTYKMVCRIDCRS